MKASKSATLNQRIRSDLESRILSGEWAPGFRIPYEHELMEQYGCSRMTVNKVLTALAESGMIERRRRAGSFVARQPPHLEQVALEIPDIAMEVGSRGHLYGYRLLQRELRLAESSNAGEVELAGQQQLLAMRCLHLADGRPLALEHRLISPVGVPEVLEVDFSTTAPGSWLLQNVSWTRAQHRISAWGADTASAQLLDVKPGTACLVIERLTWRGEQPITRVRQVFLGMPGTWWRASRRARDRFHPRMAWINGSGTAVVLNSVDACVRCVSSLHEEQGPHPGSGGGRLDLLQDSGSHHVFVHPHRSHIITVPHPQKDLGKGLVLALRKLAGLT